MEGRLPELRITHWTTVGKTLFLVRTLFWHPFVVPLLFWANSLSSCLARCQCNGPLLAS